MSVSSPPSLMQRKREPFQPVIHNLTTEERFAFAHTPPTSRSWPCMGFYPTQPMWVGKRVVPLPADLAGTPELEIVMHQSIRFYGTHNDYTMFITRDGMVVLWLPESLLRREGIDLDVTAEEQVRHVAADPMYGSMSETRFGRMWSLYVDYLNALHLLLAAAREPILRPLNLPQFMNEVTLANAMVFQHYCDDPLHRIQSRWCKFHWSTVDGSLTIEKDPSLKCVPVYVPRRDCPLVSPEQYHVFDRVDQQLSECNTARVRLLAMIARAVHAYQERSHDTCLILLWTVVESIINKRYDAFVTGESLFEAQPISAAKQGKKKNRKQSQFTAISTQIETLHQKQLLPAGHRAPTHRASPGTPKGQFRKFIEAVKQARNDFVLKAAPCQDSQCYKAYSVLADLVREDWKITLPFMEARPMIILG